MNLTDIEQESQRRYLRIAVHETLFSLIAGTLIVLGACGAGLMTLPSDWDHIPVHEFGLFRNDYPSRFSGEAPGWTREMAWRAIIGNLIHAWVYVTIGVIVFRYHSSNSTRFFRRTVYVVLAALFGCGLLHFVAAYTTINPVYSLLLPLRLVTGLLAVVTAIAVGFALGYDAWYRRIVGERVDAELEAMRGSNRSI